VVDETKVQMAPLLDERGDGGVVRSERQDALNEVAQRWI
jgi:hypothetical protein